MSVSTATCLIAFSLLLVQARYIPDEGSTMDNQLMEEEGSACQLYIPHPTDSEALISNLIDYYLCKLRQNPSTDKTLLQNLDQDALREELLQSVKVAERRNKRKLSVDMDTDLTADHFRMMEAQRKNLRKELGILEHFLHVG